MKRLAVVVVVSAPLMLFGCGSGNKNADGGADLSSSGQDLAMGGTIGAPCTMTSDCKEGTAPVCWRKTLFNKPRLLGVRGGYCSSPCTTDSDCGATGGCQDFGTDGKACIQRCMQPMDCRGAGYACFPDIGCFPNGNLTCDPTTGDGTCMTGPNNNIPGGCVRQALGTGTTGECREECAPGKGTCTPQSGFARQCVVVDETTNLDGTKTMDKYKGPTCTFTATNPGPKTDGMECLYPGPGGMMTHLLDACEDGDECYLKGMATAGMGFDAAGDNVCHKLCFLPGGMPTGVPDGGVISMGCGAQTCTDIFGLGSNANTAFRVGLCK